MIFSRKKRTPAPEPDWSGVRAALAEYREWSDREFDELQAELDSLDRHLAVLQEQIASDKPKP